MTYLYVIIAGVFLLGLALGGLAKTFDSRTRTYEKSAAAALCVVLALICAGSVILGLIIVPVKIVERRNCHYAGTQYRTPSRWDFAAGCFLKHGNRYVRLDQYRLFINRQTG
jgi:hypothetical protein